MAMAATICAMVMLGSRRRRLRPVWNSRKKPRLVSTAITSQVAMTQAGEMPLYSDTPCGTQARTYIARLIRKRWTRNC